jgi:hypothetical protein
LDFLTLEDGTDMLSRNVGKGVPLTFGEKVAATSSRVKKSKKKILLLDFLTLEDETDKLSRNVAKQLPHDAA